MRRPVTLQQKQCTLLYLLNSLVLYVTLLTSFIRFSFGLAEQLLAALAVRRPVCVCVCVCVYVCMCVALRQTKAGGRTD